MLLSFEICRIRTKMSACALMLPFSKTLMFTKYSPNSRVARWTLKFFSVVMLRIQVVNLVDICNGASVH